MNELEINIDIDAIFEALIKHPGFADAVRRVQTQDARRMGNLFGQWAQQSTPSTATRNRLT